MRPQSPAGISIENRADGRICVRFSNQQLCRHGESQWRRQATRIPPAQTRGRMTERPHDKSPARPSIKKQAAARTRGSDCGRTTPPYESIYVCHPCLVKQAMNSS